MDIRLLSPGCCGGDTLEVATRQALDELGRDETLTKVTDYGEIASYGVLSTPALVINDRVQFAGKVPPVEEIKQHIATA